MSMGKYISLRYQSDWDKLSIIVEDNCIRVDHLIIFTRYPKENVIDEILFIAEIVKIIFRNRKEELHVEKNFFGGITQKFDIKIRN